MAKKSKKVELDSPVSGSGRLPDEWEIRNWADKVMEAEEIKQDPEKMKKIRPLLKKKIKAIKCVQDIVDYRNANYGPGSEHEEE